MYSISKLQAHNFMSFEDVELYLADKCYIIKGENKDDRGQQSNGSGKTSLLEIIAITLLGQSLTDRDLKSCVNRYGEDNFFITSLILTNDQDLVEINRKVYSNTKSQELSITINGEALKDIPTKTGIKNGVDLRKGNEWILNTLLGISQKDLLNYYLISGNEYKGFLASGNQEKINVISRFSNAVKIDKILEKLEERGDKFETQIITYENENIYLKGQVEGMLLSVSDEAKQKFEEEKERRRKQLLPKLEELEKQEIVLKTECSTLENNQFQCEEFYGRLNKEQREKLYRERVELKELIDELDGISSFIKNSLRGIVTCPSCKHEFTLDSNTPVEELKLDLEVVTLDKEEVVAGHKDIDDQIQGQKLLDEIESDWERKSNQLENLYTSYKSLKESLESIDAQVFITPDVEEKKLVLEEKISDNKLLVEQLQKEQLETSLWIERFEKFKYYLINKPIAIICNKTNQMLRDIDCDYSISIEGFKKLKSGELRAELTPVVHIKGLESQPYTQFSEGEKTRLSISCDLAIQSMINSTSKGGLNLLTSDEKISALDSKGIEMVAKSFNKLNKSILLVSHSGSDLNYENVLTLRKENKKTVIV